MTTRIFIDHVPSIEETFLTMNEAYNEMRTLYEQVYGKPDEQIWTPIVATCSGGHSGFVPPFDEVEDEHLDPFEA